MTLMRCIVVHSRCCVLITLRLSSSLLSAAARHSSRAFDSAHGCAAPRLQVPCPSRHAARTPQLRPLLPHLCPAGIGALQIQQRDQTEGGSLRQGTGDGDARTCEVRVREQGYSNGFGTS